MPLTVNDKAIIAFKNLLGKSQTDSLKELGNEFEGIFLNVPSTAVYTQIISATAATAVTDGVAVLVIANMVADGTSNHHALFATWPVTPPTGTDLKTGLPFAYNVGSLLGINAGDRVRNAISSSFSADYEAKPFFGASPISVGDQRNWLYQFNSGVFWQEFGSDTGWNGSSLGDPTTIHIYAYIGTTLATTGTGGFSTVINNSNVVGTYTGLANITLTPSNINPLKFESHKGITLDTDTTNNIVRIGLTVDNSQFIFNTSGELTLVNPGGSGTNIFVNNSTIVGTYTGATDVTITTSTLDPLKFQNDFGTILETDITNNIVKFGLNVNPDDFYFNTAGELTLLNANVIGIKYDLQPTDHIIVPVNFEYLVYGDLTLEAGSSMTNYGKVVIINGSLINNGGTFNNFGSLILVDLAFGPTKRFRATFSSTANVPFTINHNLNTLDFTYAVRSGNDDIIVQLTRIDGNNVSILTTSNVNGVITIIGY